MDERSAQIVLLVKAFEEADRGFGLLSAHARSVATRRALRVTGLADWGGELAEAANIRNGETVMRRARLLYEALRRRLPTLPTLLKVAQLGSSTTPLVVGLALVAGLLTNALGPLRRINLLFFPLLAILAWNLFLFVLLAGLALYRTARRRRSGDTPRRSAHTHGDLSERLAGWLLKGALWRRLHVFKRSGVGGDRSITAKALVRFGASWHRVAEPLLAARIRRMLHLAAVVLVAGAVGGMYLRGLVLEYRATWESTLLEAESVQRLLGLVLGPAAALIGVDLPDITTLRSPASGDAAVWIHLYALTALLYVVLPRGILAAYQSWRCARLSASIPVDLEDGYFYRIFTEWRGTTKEALITPYSFSPATAVLEKLKGLLHDYLGARAEVRVGAPLEYGEEATRILPTLGYRTHWVRPTGTPTDIERETIRVVLFNLAQPPEAEVHGALIEELKSRLDIRRGRLLAMLDISGYRERIADSERLSERLRAWERVMREVDLVPVALDPDRPIDDEALATVGKSFWPPVASPETEE